MANWQPGDIGAAVSDEPARKYWRRLFPEFGDRDRSYGREWCGDWQTYEQCVGLWNERERIRRWYEKPGHDSLDPHATTVVIFHATPLRSLTAMVCLGCLWLSRSLDAEHPETKYTAARDKVLFRNDLSTSPDGHEEAAVDAHDRGMRAAMERISDGSGLHAVEEPE